MSGGVRFSNNQQTFRQELTGVLFGGSAIRIAESEDDVTTWSASVQMHTSSTSNVYLRAASGYRPGGPNVALPGVPPSFDADTLVNYELGYKASLLDGQLEVDVAAFFIDWQDIQITVTNAQNVSFPGNGGKASSRGFEVSSTYLLSADLRLGISAAFSNARLDEDVVTLNGRSGDQLPFAPQWTAGLTADYEAPLSNDISLAAGAAYRYRGSSYSDLESDPVTLRVPAQNIIDLYAGPTFGNISTRLTVRNALNDRAYSRLYDQIPANRPNFVSVQPRTVALSVDVRF